MNDLEKINIVKTSISKVSNLDDILSELEDTIRNSNNYFKRKLENDEHSMLYKRSIFSKLFKYFGISKHEESSGGHLTDYKDLEYENPNLMKEIHKVVLKYREIEQSKVDNYLSLI